MENNNLNILDEINKGATMGMDAISYVSEKVGDETFSKVLDGEYNKYKDISRRVNNLYSNYSDKEPHETNAMNKMMTWYGIQMNTITDKSNSKISELLMQGTNMGIIEGRRLLNQNQENIATDVKNILNDFVVMQEDSVETLKKYL
jgi:coproporphyrinogen III oxidase-like Fe-S oxidoreductase